MGIVHILYIYCICFIVSNLWANIYNGTEVNILYLESSSEYATIVHFVAGMSSVI